MGDKNEIESDLFWIYTFCHVVFSFQLFWVEEKIQKNKNAWQNQLESGGMKLASRGCMGMFLFGVVAVVVWELGGNHGFLTFVYSLIKIVWIICNINIRRGLPSVNVENNKLGKGSRQGDAFQNPPWNFGTHVANRHSGNSNAEVFLNYVGHFFKIAILKFMSHDFVSNIFIATL